MNNKPKTVTCKRCGTCGLVWAQTKAGKYYLTDADATNVKGASGRTVKTLRLAHKCPTPEQTRNNARDLRYEALRQLPEYLSPIFGHEKAVKRVIDEMGNWE
jgi:hypothetical protein